MKEAVFSLFGSEQCCLSSRTRWRNSSDDEWTPAVLLSDDGTFQLVASVLWHAWPAETTLTIWTPTMVGDFAPRFHDVQQVSMLWGPSVAGVMKLEGDRHALIGLRSAVLEGISEERVAGLISSCHDAYATCATFLEAGHMREYGPSLCSWKCGARSRLSVLEWEGILQAG